MKRRCTGHMAAWMGRFIAVGVAVFLCGVLFWIGNDAWQSIPAQNLEKPDAQKVVIVLDPGHGGEDGGAVGADGTREKDLNLSVARMAAEILRIAGYDVRLTRTDDRLLYDLYDDLTDYTGHKKNYDLRNRLRFTRESGAALLVSIHMNTFPQPGCRGLQVYYAPAEGSQHVAEGIQSYVKTYLQPQNTRQAKAATSAIYLLSRAECPSVLVECGFLSNEEELASLNREEYRRALALSLACAVCEAVP